MRILVLVAAAWRLCSLLVEEEGPDLVLARLRDAVGVYYDENSQRQASTELGKLFICIWCMSVWVGWIFAAFELFTKGTPRRLWRWFTTGLALSAGAILWEKYSGASK